MAIWIKPEDRGLSLSNPKVGAEGHIEDHKALALMIYSAGTMMVLYSFTKSNVDEWTATMKDQEGATHDLGTIGDAVIAEVLSQHADSPFVIYETPYGEVNTDAESYAVGDVIKLEIRTSIQEGLPRSFDSFLDYLFIMHLDPANQKIDDLTARLEALENPTNPE